MEATPRFPSLDVIRGVAVMGILLANIVAFGLPEAAYFSPLAWGGSELPEKTAWFLNFVFVEGRFRGLFSFLFGASMLLVIERADAAGENGAELHLRRMFWLFVFGCIHLYLFWWGDILAHYALVGVLALFFGRQSTRTLVLLSLALLVVALLLNAATASALFAAAARATAGDVALWKGFASAFGVPPRAELLEQIAAMRGSFGAAAAWRWNHALDPLTFLPIGGAETLGAMLLGMAALRTGFVTGEWSRHAYARVALVCVPLSLIGYAAIGSHTMATGFDQRYVYLGSLVVSEPFRTIGYVGYAALVILLLRPDGALSTRIGAAGRMAFSNYLGTTLLMDLVFAGWGLGLFGVIGRTWLYAIVPLVWAIMLVWSPAWLARYRYGPLEWLWRSVVRGRPAALRR
ncbi:DUF418 domain-containing protein [Sphingomonas sp. RHCKR47]|uniref:DUF418 domain-containing protein n=1 Tax=Sphingomonas citricola TaxID=2862498 RepID=UPI001C67DA3D|nr:DUF418 domain-containing protein [Sphingomonas citricola]MBW6523218.1 DUF418 domain-containing protein [Sphingomonas citricola]